MSRLKLRFKAVIFRTLAYINALLDRYFSTPPPQRSSFTRSIPSSHSQIPGSIRLLFFSLKTFQHPSSLPAPNTTQKPHKGHPILINFHGGGFSIGIASDDARWATQVCTQANAFVISVQSRRAPEHPFPTAIEDCVSAILWIWEHGFELGLDVSPTAISGFSAGGNLSLAAPVALRDALAKPKSDGGDTGVGKLVGIVSFYPSTDWIQTRAQRDASNANMIPVIPPWLYRFFDEAYLYPPPNDMADPLLSPGLASDEVLLVAMPQRVVLIRCSGDQLLAESEVFCQCLKRLGIVVEGYVVQGVGHAWDKKATFRRADVKRDEAYGAAVEGLREMWDMKDSVMIGTT
jgi:acetyl esterase/lipase